MKKNSKILSILCTVFAFINLGIQAGNYTAKADEVIVANKGYEINNMVYLGDQGGENIVMETEKYNYGYYSLWDSCYKYIVDESNGSKTCYYFILIESTIASSGHKQNRYFRNKEMKILIDFYSDNSCGDEPYLAVYEPEGSTSTTTKTITIGVSASAGVAIVTGGYELSVGFEASITYTKTVIEDIVKLTLDKGTTSAGHKTLEYQYYFSNYKDGAMVSPNVGAVTKRMVAVYAVENYTGIDSFTLNITTTASIFKDATWPLKNYTFTDSLSHSYVNGVVV